jgi:hypothetical protein
MIEELNRAGADLALETGESFVATPIGSPKAQASKLQPPKPQQRSSVPNPPKELKAPEMPPQPQAKPVTTRSTVAAQPRPASDPDFEAIMGDLKSITSSLPGPFVIAHLESEPSVEMENLQEKSPSSAFLPAPGSLLYAVTEVAVNSDVAAPVLAQVAAGPLKGARLLGAFQLGGDALSIRFTKLMPQGQSPIDIEAFAVDPRTNSPSVSGKVDRHFLERWGGLMAASFLEGFGEAMSNRGTTVHAYGDVIVADKGAVDLDDVSLEALGRVGSRAATQLEKGFDRPPTVTIPSGSPIGVLIVATKS